MRRYKIIGILFVFLVQWAYSQSVTQTLTGPKGTWLPVIEAKTGKKGDFTYLKQGEKVIIGVSYGNKDFRSLTEVALPASVQEFEQKAQLYGVPLQEMAQSIDLTTIQALYDKVMDALNKGDTNFIGSAIIDNALQQLLAVSYLDTERDIKKAARYQLQYVDASGKVKRTVEIEAPAYEEFSYPPLKGKILVASDSLISTEWSREKMEDEKIYKASLFQRLKGKTEYKFAKSIPLVETNPNSAFLKTVFSVESIPNSQYDYAVRYEDYAGNLSEMSPQLSVISVGEGSLMPIENLSSKDTINGIYLSWKPLPKQALYTGIEVSKSRTKDQDYVVLDTIPITESSYLDTKVLSSSMYYYRVRPLYLGVNGGADILPAEIFQSRRDSDNIPDAPAAVQAEVVENGIKISWTPTTDLLPYGYYLYRGTSADNMEWVSGAGVIKTTSYVDTTYSKGYSGNYVYGVKVKTISQKMSEMSSPAYVQIQQKIDLPAPMGISTMRYGKQVEVSWDDIRERDSRINGYLVYRRVQGEKEWTSLNKEGDLYVRKQIIDTISPLYSCEYAVYSADTWGNISDEPVTTVLESNTSYILAPPTNLEIISFNEGIQISAPELLSTDATFRNRKYIIYKKNNKDVFEKIAEIGNGESYMDKDVKQDVLYEYKFSSTVEGKEGRQSNVYTQRQI